MGERGDDLWFPHEPVTLTSEEQKCQLTCFSRENSEFYNTGENVVDGTACSYDEASDICVQGDCIKLGCDRVSIYNILSVESRHSDLCFTDNWIPG